MVNDNENIDHYITKIISNLESDWEWSRYYIKLGFNLFNYKSEDKRLIFAIKVPTFHFISTLISIGILLNRDLVRNKSLDRLSFEDCRKIKEGAVIEFSDDRGINWFRWLFIKCEELGPYKIIHLKPPGKKKDKKTPLSRGFAINHPDFIFRKARIDNDIQDYTSSEILTERIKRKMQKKRFLNHVLSGEQLHRYLLGKEDGKCTIVCGKSAYKEEIEKNFNLKKFSNKKNSLTDDGLKNFPEESTINFNELIFLDGLGGSGISKIHIFKPRTKYDKKEKNSFTIFRGSNSYYNNHNRSILKNSNQIIILDKSDSKINEAVNLINGRYEERSEEEFKYDQLEQNIENLGSHDIMGFYEDIVNEQ